MVNTRSRMNSKKELPKYFSSENIFEIKRDQWLFGQYRQGNVILM